MFLFRIRTPSYSRLEQQILVDLIDSHRMVLDCKASDASTNQKKNIAWEEISNQYNNCGGVETVRTVHQLKR